MIPEQNWVYRAKATRVIDGDTIEVIIDNGFYNRRVERFRLLDVNCPEMKAPTHEAGLEAKSYTSKWLSVIEPGNEWPLIVQSVKADSFGRFLATVWRTVDGACLNEDLISSGHAVPYIR